MRLTRGALAHCTSTRHSLVSDCLPSSCYLVVRREGNEPSQEGSMSYQQLLDLVCKIANYLKSIGVKKGDDVTIYM